MRYGIAFASRYVARGGMFVTAWGLRSVDLYNARGSVGFGLVLGAIGSAAVSAQAVEPSPSYASPPKITLTTWRFNGANGANPEGGIFIDTAGNLLGTASEGGAFDGGGVVFIIAKAATGYAKALSLVASFNFTDGDGPTGALIADASGNLYGTTFSDQSSESGVIFEITHGAAGYAKTPNVLSRFGAAVNHPYGSLAMDPSGNLFGTGEYSGDENPPGYGGVFELKKTASGYAKTPTVISLFDYSDGEFPLGGVLIDASGSLYGTTSGGGAYGVGTVFVDLKTATGYRSVPTTLHTFGPYHEGGPFSGVVADASGNLFGTTANGGPYNYGVVYELVKVAAGYSYKILVNFDLTNGGLPYGGLILDASGNLFGTTGVGGTYGNGTVFKISKNASGYASSPTILVNFNGQNVSSPGSTLVADSAGNLFGTSEGGGAPYFLGTVFEVSGSGFAVKK